MIFKSFQNPSNLISVSCEVSVYFKNAADGGNPLLDSVREAKS